MVERLAGSEAAGEIATINLDEMVGATLWPRANEEGLEPRPSEP